MRAGPTISVAHVAGRIAVGYAMAAVLATALALALREEAPWIHPEPWLSLSSGTAEMASAGMGLGLALTLLIATRLFVARFEWAQRLHLELRPYARGMSAGQIALVAVCSSLGEELLFRGLLQPFIGLVLSSLLFGLLHQAPGKSRWVWAGWAAIVGAAMGAIFAATGSLVGPLLAHALVNGVNLAFLRDHDLVQSGSTAITP